MNEKLTLDEYASLLFCENEENWDKATKAIKAARNNAYPMEWFSRIVASGLMKEIADSWKGSIRLTTVGPAEDGVVHIEPPSERTARRELLSDALGLVCVGKEKSVYPIGHVQGHRYLPGWVAFGWVSKEAFYSSADISKTARGFLTHEGSAMVDRRHYIWGCKGIGA